MRQFSMAEVNSLVNVGDLAKPAAVLIEKVLSKTWFNLGLALPSKR
jgi:hypothetical protein